MPKSKWLFLGRFKALWGHGSMREPSEIVTVSRMQNMVDIRKKNTCFVTIFFFDFFEKVLLGLSGFRAPRWGHSVQHIWHPKLKTQSFKHISCLSRSLFIPGESANGPSKSMYVNNLKRDWDVLFENRFQRESLKTKRSKCGVGPSDKNGSLKLRLFRQV